MKTAILLDSTFYMYEKQIKKYGFYVVPILVNFETTSYKEVPNNFSQSKEIFERIKNEKTIPKTSQPSAAGYFEQFEKIKADGYERVVVLTISSKLSGTIQGATVAAKMYMEETGGLQIETYDSINVAQPAAIAAIEIAKQLAEEGDISPQEIKKILKFYSENAKIYLMVDTLDFLAYGGRISNTIAAVGNIFGVKPILQVKEGEIIEFSKVRSTKKAYKIILEEFNKTMNPNEEYYLLATHTQAEKEAKKLLKVAYASHTNCENIIDTFPLGPVVGIHVGPGSVAIGWAPKYKKEVN